ncbi:MAG TPA: HRDC domain-containing protein, partial [Polyangiales bacterium]
VARVIANDLLLRLAELSEPSQEDLERRLSTRARPFVAHLVEAYQRAANRTDAPPQEIEPGEMPSPNEIARRKRRRALLTEFRTAEAKRREVDPQVVLPGHCLHDIVTLPALTRDALRTVAGFGEARLTRYGESWPRELGPKWNA